MYELLIVPLLILNIVVIASLWLNAKKEYKRGYKQGDKENRGLSMDMIHLINNYVAKSPFLVVNVCGRYLAVRLPRKDNPNFTSTFFVKFDSEKDLEEVKPGQLYRINSVGGIEKHPPDPMILDKILRKPEK